MKTLLITGAAGRIGTFLRTELAGKYSLRLSDVKPIRDLRKGETFMRAGNVNPAPLDLRRLAIWISPRDMAQLVTIGIERPNIHFEIVYGISNNKRAWFDNRNAHRLGYRPRDRSEPHAKAILARENASATADDSYQDY
jgi:hypothetical protein